MPDITGSIKLLYLGFGIFSGLVDDKQPVGIFHHCHGISECPIDGGCPLAAAGDKNEKIICVYPVQDTFICRDVFLCSA